MTARACQWITRYFGPSRKGGTYLPAALERWLAFQSRPFPGGIPAPHKPLVIEAQTTRLVLRLLVKGDRKLLLLQEQERSIRSKPLEALGVTPREAEVLAWIAEGKTSADAATILGTSRRTIEKHLEHIYVKLGSKRERPLPLRRCPCSPRSP